MCFIPISGREHAGKISQDLVFLMIFLSTLDLRWKQLAEVLLSLCFWFLTSEADPTLFQWIPQLNPVLWLSPEQRQCQGHAGLTLPGFWLGLGLLAEPQEAAMALVLIKPPWGTQGMPPTDAALVPSLGLWISAVLNRASTQSVPLNIFTCLALSFGRHWLHLLQVVDWVRSRSPFQELQFCYKLFSWRGWLSFNSMTLGYVFKKWTNPLYH